MPRLRALIRQRRHAGHIDSPWIRIKPEHRNVTVRLPRWKWPDTGKDVFKLRISVSKDHGETVEYQVTTTDTGGNHFDKQGNLKIENAPSFDLVNDGAQRWIKIDLWLDAELDTEVVLDVR